jgi:HEAT repeat protein
MCACVQRGGLKNVGGAEVVEELRQALHDSDWLVCVSAAKSLENVSSAEVVEDLRQALMKDRRVEIYDITSARKFRR